ncbi:hypothetical protein GXM_06706 [Nostoc sphaeroides CCNUC1]|uniref:Uncharacterized protein n=1 Tax=Nostoc sphaeroides CCNUC1 TaxID=2653204 RepID=A0A5P8W9H9_9NOSO|nr:hypothetical protein GXM_06706 [Nostoc sphaeroides CCNUC1]
MSKTQLSSRLFQLLRKRLEDVSFLTRLHPQPVEGWGITQTG